ncbi:hypothetical protein HMPREF0208_02100 [Citrobacter koseri]|nr:hypothetical protein HMPREF3220_03442 [Citrobacter koseri]KXA00735.1 hypothetical protein HMPREF3207_03393 [Citrobacter koseri]KXB44145.1 hypothetical protein HMPREF0208_02100 [Citrobacter koseri]
MSGIVFILKWLKNRYMFTYITLKNLFSIKFSPMKRGSNP